MKAFLLNRDRDFDPDASLPPHADDTAADLELEAILAVMARGDRFLWEVARRGIQRGLETPDAIRYRQGILADCLDSPDVVRRMYDITVAAIEGERKVMGWWAGRFPSGLLHRAVDVLQLFMDHLAQLRGLAEEHGPGYASEGLRRFCRMLIDELDAEYVATVSDHLERLRFPDGIVMSARLGAGNKGLDYVLRSPGPVRRGWLDRLIPHGLEGHVYQVPPRDEAGLKALSELRDQGLALVAAALAQSTDHIGGFLRAVRAELGFYVGCLNLAERLAELGAPLCFPEPMPAGAPVLTAQGLYDLALRLTTDQPVVSNDLAADGAPLLMVTGANRGGKSTFLRSLGQAQLLMQAGMFVPAKAFRADVRRGPFTHFKREEDAGMRSGKLDEELGRMSRLVDSLEPASMVLLNESFASTNEREGSEIARQIVRALLDAGVKVAYVTHMFDLAGSFAAEDESFVFLRAERKPDGLRTFRIVPAAPEPTSHGGDLYRRIFHRAAAAESAS